MVDMLICPCYFQPPPAKALFSMGHLMLLLEQVDLSGQCLDLLIHRSVVVDLGHKTPIVTGELIESMADGGEGGATAKQC